MTKGRIALLFVAAVVFLSVGFVIGQIVQAAGTIPGTAGDPLVAQSYVEKAVQKNVAEMEKKLQEMEKKVASLEKQLKDAPKNTANNNKTNNQTSGGGISTGGDNKPIADGKVAIALQDDTNVRSGPGTTYNKVVTLKQGDTMTVVLEENGWYQVDLPNGQEGWVANWVVKVN